MKRRSTIWREKKFSSVGKRDICVDLGACVGYVTSFLAKNAKKGLVIAVEPVYENYKKLVRLIVKNGYENVIPIFAGMADKSGVSSIYISDMEQAHSSYWDDRFSSIKRPMLVSSWDDLMEMLNLDKVDFLKVDINGAEVKLLEGMTKVLPKRIFIEDDTKIKNPNTLWKNKEFHDRLLSLLAEKGYKIKEEVKYWYLLEL